MKKIIIDPRSNYAYSSFYLYGLEQLVGRKNITYDIKPFKHLGDLGNDLRFIVCDDVQTKYFIHANDPYQLLEDNYNWCDVYGHVNANYSHYPKDKYPKLISLVPSFGIRKDASLIKVLLGAGLQFLYVWQDVLNRKEWNKYDQRMECNKWRNLKHYFTRRIRTWQNRLPLSTYDSLDESKGDYIFFLSTLWYSNEWNNNDEGVNLRRAYFIRACKKVIGDKFEGGLLGDDSSSNSLFADVLCSRKESYIVWLGKSKQSALVFNTPAFWDCHGWKLGEYLALGKCIISTKLSNDLPYPLEHGVNIHFVENTEDAMQEAIEYILSNPEYRKRLEQGAKDYWTKYGTPEASLKLLGVL